VKGGAAAGPKERRHREHYLSGGQTVAGGLGLCECQDLSAGMARARRIAAAGFSEMVLGVVPVYVVSRGNETVPKAHDFEAATQLSADYSALH